MTKYAKEGQIVRLHVPRVVKRVGYNMAVHEVRDELRNNEELREEIRKLYSKYVVSGEYKSAAYLDILVTRLCGEMAYVKCKAYKFGGNERKIIFQKTPELSGMEFRVLKKSRVNLGFLEASSDGVEFLLTERKTLYLVERVERNNYLTLCSETKDTFLLLSDDTSIVLSFCITKNVDNQRMVLGHWCSWGKYSKTDTTGLTAKVFSSYTEAEEYIQKNLQPGCDYTVEAM